MHNPERFGIVGDGQLGRMLTLAARDLSPQIEVTALGENERNPSSLVGAKHLQGEISDPNRIEALVLSSDVTTWESDHIEATRLAELYNAGHRISPSPHSLLIVQDKLLQKQHLYARGTSGIQVAPFRRVDDDIDLSRAREELGDIIVKTRFGGFDGRGNYQPLSNDGYYDIARNIGKGGKLATDLYAEQVIDFDSELAVIVGRDSLGNVAVYPVVETIHRDSICHMTIAPARIGRKMAGQAEELGRAVVDRFDGPGVFVVEEFLVGDQVYVNEVASRVHNSGHWTIEGAETSQFMQHTRAVLGLSLGSTAMTADVAVMINILGTREEDEFDIGQFNPIIVPEIVNPHGYDKSPRPARKIGHITVLGTSYPEAIEQAEAARARISA